MAYKYEYAKSNLNVFIKGLELLAQENKWKFDSIEELMTTKLLKDKDLLRIKQLRVKDLAEKYEVCINRITLNENGEIDQEIQQKDIKSNSQIMREKKKMLKNKLSIGPLHWT